MDAYKTQRFSLSVCDVYKRMVDQELAGPKSPAIPANLVDLGLEIQKLPLASRPGLLWSLQPRTLPQCAGLFCLCHDVGP